MAKSQTQAQKEVDKHKHDLKQGSLEIKALSAQIDKGLKLAQDWFAKLDGKVETTIEILDPDPDPETTQHFDMTFQCRLAKPNWVLEGRWMARDFNGELLKGNSEEWDPISSASMATKMAALHALPVLYSAMVDSQNRYINELRRATEKFAEFAEVTGLLSTGGA